ncbi:hypothetical protein [Escherichia coli ISC41]|nr:hypothetical protein [Escherichia coli ISC41]
MSDVGTTVDVFSKTGRYRFFISLTAYLAILSAAWIALRIFLREIYAG